MYVMEVFCVYVCVCVMLSVLRRYVMCVMYVVYALSVCRYVIYVCIYVCKVVARCVYVCL